MVDYLYHYTNLDTLRLILQNKTFRLSSLSRMDDLEEGDTKDFQKLGRFIYISSWTSNPNESLLLWNYSRGNEGVRIRMKPNIFKTEKINRKVSLHGKSGHVNNEFNIGLLDLMQNENVLFQPTQAELFRVTYTDLDRLLRPKVYTKHNDGSYTILTQDLGIFKKVEWQDQQEWRYRLSSIPLNANEIFFFEHSEAPEELIDKIRTREDLGYVDLPLKDDVFEDLEILCGPKMSESGKIELKKILDNYAPNTIIKNSGIRIRH
ncbi:hypothetical protein ACTNEO_04960 [Gracilibacillus sp. HCP3S3_G5_1]|jgi:hypothetical protein|uniref:hypothetical protein n=1 Tax=unclassified Gracilibacillus TaxID=2625209 RepID=UPI003F8C744C